MNRNFNKKKIEIEHCPYIYFKCSEDFAYKPISEEGRKKLFERIILDSWLSLDLLLVVDYEFFKNKRKNIISPIERYHLINSICLKPRCARDYLKNEYYLCTSKLERIKLIKSVVTSEEQTEYLINHTSTKAFNNLGSEEIDILLNAIFDFQDKEYYISRLYNRKNIKLNEGQLNRIAPIIITEKFIS